VNGWFALYRPSRGRLSLEPSAPFSCRPGHSSREPPGVPRLAVLWSASPWPPCVAASASLLPPPVGLLGRRPFGGVYGARADNPANAAAAGGSGHRVAPKKASRFLISLSLRATSTTVGRPGSGRKCGRLETPHRAEGRPRRSPESPTCPT